MNSDKGIFQALKPLCKRIIKRLGTLGIHDFPVKKESLERLYVSTDAKEAQEEQACRCIGYMLIIVFVTAVLAIAVLIGAKCSLTKDGFREMRPGKAEQAMSSNWSGPDASPSRYRWMSANNGTKAPNLSVFSKKPARALRRQFSEKMQMRKMSAKN